MTGRVRLIVGLFIALIVVLNVGAAHADKRVALVIGNSAYRNVPALANPKNDASDIAEKLKGMGFEVVLGEDLDLNGLRSAIRQFAGALDGADLALFFYAGHGLQVNGQNYIAPVDAKLASAIDLDFEMVPMDLVLSAMERATKTNLIFLDACRDNPLAENLARSMGTRSAAVGRGLAKIGSGVGSLIAFSTQPGNVALDGKGRNSPFTTALLKHLGTPGESITDDLTAVRRDVLAATDGKQVPWDNSSLTGPVVLVKKPAEPKPEARAEPASPQVPSMPSNLAEITYWDTIKDSSDKSFFEAYLKRYPGGNYADLAKLKIAMIERAESTRQATKEAPANPVETAKLEQPAPADATPAIALDPVELAREMQTELNRLGCSVGTVDGVWGPGSERALKDYADRQGVKLASTDPTAEILDRLKATTIRVCPLVCGAGTEEKNGRCVNVRQQANIDSQPKGSKQKISEPQTGQTSARSDGRTCYLCFRSGIGKTEKVCARNYVELRDMLGNGCCSCKKL